MQTTLAELVNKYEIPKAWVAKLCGLSRTQVSNWVTDPEKYPMTEAKKQLVQEKLQEIGKVLNEIELM